MPRQGRYNWRQPSDPDRRAFIYDSAEAVQTRIGNPDQLGFSPEISFKKWDGESFLKLLLPSPPGGRVPEIDENQKIEIDYNSHRHQWFIRDDPNESQFEAFEWEIVFPSKPSSNVIEFSIETENLSFYRQELQEHPPHPVIIPDNVIGSYAVYHSSRAHGKYKTGKVCHIYRPKAIDASAHEVWCELFIDAETGLFRITVPQDFLDNAVYPVVVDPTFGWTNFGSQGVSVGPDWCYAPMNTNDYYMASSGDNVNELFVAISSPNESGDDMAMAIYTIFKGQPKSKVMESSRFSVSNVADWYSVEVDQDLDDSETYCVAAGEFSTGSWYFRFDTGGAVESSENGSAFRQTWSGSDLSYRFSMYAEYTEAGGDVFVTPDPASAVAAKVDPTVILGSIAITPSPISAVGSKVDPTVILGSLSLTPSAVSAVAGKNDPSVILGSITIIPAVASAIGEKADPVVILGSMSFTPSPASAVTAVFGPTVIEGGDIIFSPDPASAIAGINGPTVVQGSIVMTPTPASAIGAGLDPTVVLGNIALTPIPASSIGSKNDPVVILGSVSFTPTAASAIGAVAGPTVIEGGDITFTPTPASAISGKADPAVILGSITLTPEAVAAIGVTAGPNVVLGSLVLTPGPASAVGTVVVPIVILGSIALTPEAVTAIAERSGPTVFLSSITFTPAAAAAVGAKLDPTVILGSIAITPNPVAVIGDVSGPNVIIGVLVAGISLKNIEYGAGLSASAILKGSSQAKNIQYGPGLTIEEG